MSVTTTNTDDAAVAITMPLPPGDASLTAADTQADGQPIRPLRPADPPTNWLGRFIRRVEGKLSTLSSKSNFWHRTLSRVFLPLAYRSGIRFRSQPGDPFEVVMPFRRFNKNWYNAMAGAALLANAEIAGGMYIFKHVGKEFTVVCKELHYKFMRPCLGPAIYRIDEDQYEQEVDQDGEPVDGAALRRLVDTKPEFNFTVVMQVFQAVVHKDQRQRRVGVCTATFHVAPKSKLRARKAKAKLDGKAKRS
jgi:acyl-coenzyme A thioesterase PaaI-like protein